MRNRFDSTLLLLVSAIILASGCGADSGPTTPSLVRTLPLQDASPVTAAAPIHTANTVNWACLTQAFAPAERQLTWQSLDCPTGAVRPTFGPAAVTRAAVAPPAPSGLTASVAGTTVMLQWLGVAGAASYVVEAGSAPGLIDRARFDTLSSATTLMVVNVSAGAYFVRVRATGGGELSAPSNEVTVVVAGGAPCVPNAPAGLRAARAGSTVTLSWSAPSGGCAPGWYVIEAGSAAGLANVANFSTGSTATAYVAVGVASGAYYVRVRAATSAGTSGPSNEVFFTIDCAVAAPTGLVGNVNGSTVTLAWRPGSGGCAASDYVIQAGSSPGLSNLATFSTGGIATTVTVPGVAPGTYYVRVRASIGSTWSDPSNEVLIIVPAPIPCRYAFYPSSASWTASGGPATTTLSASCSWSLSADVPWITIASALSGSGDAVVSYVVGSNMLFSTRAGRIVAQGPGGTVTFTVTQVSPQPPSTLCSLVFTPSSQSAVSSGGTYQTMLLAYGPLGDPASCSWQLLSDSSWLTAVPTNGVGSVLIAYTVSPNGGVQRTGTMVARAATGTAIFTVTQQAAGAVHANGTFRPTPAPRN
jgi:hypothetical protein